MVHLLVARHCTRRLRGELGFGALRPAPLRPQWGRVPAQGLL